MNRQMFTASLVLVLALTAAAAAHFAQPTHMMADERQPAISLASMVPAAFGDWKLQPNAGQLVVNPQMQATLDAIYSQTLSRTYVNARGQSVMLSIAYGRDQRDQLQVHHPEICYPAQGFQVLSNRTGSLQTAHGLLPVRRLETTLGPQRPEPVTYWMLIADMVTPGGIDKKMKEMQFGLHGVVPDGLLVRVSSVEADSMQAFDLQNQFVNDLLNSLQPKFRKLLAGHY